ncbi:hypothetical protein JRQ81_006095 [Phrynocephalus forsythii]|uniref:G-protein coupled receptors family 3 profile domain-containing protein n=1 Tax=Phrynocephalus forsythii TaxID=171643 RepID=A0A9Q0XKC0_9SAUR|nr:hypothetical protein JRQ81_006095 [Phrynocephalus forsythii]
MFLSEGLQHVGIVHLLRYFGWNWVGLVVSEDDSGETFLQTLTKTLLQSHICIAYTISIPKVSLYLPIEVIRRKLRSIQLVFSMIDINVMLVHGDRQSLEGLRFILYTFEFIDMKPQRRVWITTAQWDYTALTAGLDFTSKTLNGTLSFALHTKVVPGFQDFIRNINPFQSKIYFIHQFWCTVFLCSLPLQGLQVPGANNCTGQEELSGLPGSVFEMRMSGHSYSVYNAVYFVAHALHTIYSLRSQQKGKRDGDKWDPLNIHPWQLHSVLKSLRFNNNAGEEIFLNEKREVATGFDIINFFILPNGSFHNVQVGRLDPQAPAGEEFILNGSAIVWNQKFNQSLPISICVESCHRGQSMFIQLGKQVCCYDCIQCPEGSISIQKDAEQCMECPEDQYPNRNHNQCLPKNINYLSYGEPLGAAFTLVSLFFFTSTAVVMWTFIQHRDTPIIKSSNWSITCTLLSSLLYFLCPLLFIGWPGKVTCLLRQTVFGILFTLSVACVLAKTITVVLAFMATKPGSRMRKWIGNRLAILVIIPSCFLQMGICGVWLAMAPPFPELDMHSQMEAIIVQCNEGSSLMFYTVLGYMGLLALICFTVAFHARKLPDAFNEAKWITFSMLVFCSVWVSFVPTYLSTKGKYMVAVEVFSILASAAGLIPKNYQHILAFAFAVKEINKKDKLLPNTTLDYKIYDNAFDSWIASGNTLDLLFPGKIDHLNYNCARKGKAMAVIGGLTSHTSMQMAHILNVYNIPQISYGSFDSTLSDKNQFPFIYRMIPSDDPQYIGIVQLLKHFGWNWLGLVVSEDESGETFLRTMKPMLLQNHICIAETIVISRISQFLSKEVFEGKVGPIWLALSLIEINVMLVHGDRQSLEGLRLVFDIFEFRDMQPQRRVWVVPGFQDFVKDINLFQSKIYFIHQFWCTVFLCSLPLQGVQVPGANNCTGQEELSGLPGTVFEMRMSGQSYSVYNAVYFVAHALHTIYSLRTQQKGKRNGEKWDPENIYPWKLHSVLKSLRFNNNAGEEIFLNEKGEVATGFDIINFFISPNGSFHNTQVGQLDPQAPAGQEFILNGSAIVWNQKFNQRLPTSTCVESCHPGQSMFIQPGKQVCCYDCIQCPEGRISIQKDAEQCKRCPEDQYPNRNHNQCLPKNMNYLSYEEPLGAVFTSVSLFFFTSTAVVMWTFIQHRDTPIIKANNWSITCTLLSSLLLCFLCPLLFIGWPGKANCLLRQTVFGILFTVSVACVLAKTITVVLAFMATKPGSRMRKWIGKRLTVLVIIPSCFLQMGICGAWLAMAPPFPELDMHSQMEAIIVQCNEGSSLMFYTVLGYMGLLALISFTVAFHARKLPDAFNEAKWITFSMLVFCSVWVSFFPTYLSTKGKYVVAVEIFSILASGAGLLGCLFLPKVYIVILKPELNTRKQHVLAFAFAVKEINKKDKLLTNTTLAYKIYDNAFDSLRASGMILRLLFQGRGIHLNYDCGGKEKAMAVVGGLTSQTSIQMAHILNVYNIPQLSYGSFDPALSDKAQFPFFYRMIPNEEPQYVGIIHLLRYFGWNWVGLVVSEDDSGETFLHTLTAKLLQSRICIAETIVIPKVSPYLPKEEVQGKLRPIQLVFSKIKINVMLVHGDRQSLEGLRFILDTFEFTDIQPQRRVWITTAQWDYTALTAGMKLSSKTLNGTLSFALHTKVVPGFQDFVKDINPFQSKIYFIHQFWCTVFLCSLPLHGMHVPDVNNCTGQEELSGLPGSVFEMRMSGQSYSVYNAVYFVAHALHTIYSLRTQQKGKRNGEKWDPLNIHPWQLHSVLKSLRFNNNAGEEIFLNEKGELATGFDIINFFISPNGSFHNIQVGRMNPQAPAGEEFILNASAIVWNQKFNQKLPTSTCVESCHPGQSMFIQPGKQVCCYDCIQCPKGRISSQRDAEQCKECPEDRYPNQNHNQCLPKNMNYLSYEEPLGVVLASLSLFLSMGTATLIWTFIRHRDTPIVKATNWSITCTLLSSLLLCFLCPLLFIGWPGKANCLLRQTVFGILFTISVACVLAKTITVVLAFMATKPGSRMRKWVGKRLTILVIIPSCFLQMGICVAWLAMAPPFPELDMHSQMEAIIVQCNEGSSLMFYTVLGYMGLLALISFTVAFHARKLPDAFNEAKWITFSMLVFCSVWVSFVPTYLSTKEKYTVAVEVFSILASGAGLLGCLFLPKVYIVILKPELNTRKQLTRKQTYFQE